MAFGIYGDTSETLVLLYVPRSHAGLDVPTAIREAPAASGISV
jgi:hypothetical protein